MMVNGKQDGWRLTDEIGSWCCDRRGEAA